MIKIILSAIFTLGILGALIISRRLYEYPIIVQRFYQYIIAAVIAIMCTALLVVVMEG